jgi:hypothetical protein
MPRADAPTLWGLNSIISGSLPPDPPKKTWSQSKTKRKSREFRNRYRRWPTASDIGEGGLPSRRKLREHFETMEEAVAEARTGKGGNG